MEMSRRQVLLSSVSSVGAIALAGCTTGPNGVYGFDPTVLDAIQKGVAVVAAYIPTF
jgi:hypothetical protein